MKKSPLYDFEKSINANIQPYDKWQLPESYGDINNEVLETRKELTFIDISNRGKLRLSGKDHLRLLQGMLTNDVLKLEPGKGNISTILTNKGKIISDMRVFKDDDYVLLDTEPGINTKLKEHLLKFRLSYKADIEDVTDDFGLIHVSGAKCAVFMMDNFNLNNEELDEYDHRNIDQLIIMKINRTGDIGFDLLFENNMANRVIDKIKDKALINPAGLEALEIMRIEAGIPKYGVDMDERTIPIEAGLWSALDFEKGCYVGQEVVARIKWRGRVNRHLVSLSIEGEKTPLPKDKIVAVEKEIGKITSATFSPTKNKVIALGYIRREFKDRGSKAEVLFSNGIKASLEVVDNSFHSRFN